MTRARDIGLPLDGRPGPWNAITDVAGVEVGFTTLVAGQGPLRLGQGPVRTGVTAVLPRGKRYDPVFAACYSLNGNGELTGTAWIEESGFLESPLMITNTAAVGTVRDAVTAWMYERELYDPIAPGVTWFLPAVGETYDGLLNDLYGGHVRAEHARAALDGAASGPVAEGSVGGGTGMTLYQFKGGTGTASRRLDEQEGGYTLGVLVQANFGSRRSLTVCGVPVGREIPDLMPEIHPPGERPEHGSVIAVVATDAPLLPHQLKRLARRVPMGLARTGSFAANGSGDLFLAFSTANPGAARRTGTAQLEMLPNDRMNPLLEAAVQAVEEAVINALLAAEPMQGINDNRFYALPHERLLEIMRFYGRLPRG